MLLRGGGFMAKRKRIGLIVPSSDVTCEPDFMMALPDEVSLHSHRVWLPEEGSGEKGMKQMMAGIPDAAQSLATADIDVVAYGCTTGSFYNGPAWGAQIIKWMEDAAHVPGFVTSNSVVEALKFFGAKKLSIATPYPEWNNQKLRDYFAALDYEVLNLDADPWVFESPDRLIGDREPEDILEFAASICHPDADVLFCSCTAWRGLEIADALEERTGKNVVTSNQAMIWLILRRLGFTEPIHGYGKLMESLAGVPA
jgi:maleate cis-trans isomerase